MPRPQPADRMTPQEFRASVGLSGVVGLRMLGLFIILPVFALYAESLPGGSDRMLVGAALGAYGLTQAIFQIPFGWLSDRWGRKPTIYLGLLILAVGSVVAGLADSIWMVVLGRVIQGAGAVSAAVVALTSDLTRDVVRTKAMAIIGTTISLTFALSIIGGPILGRWIGVPGIFLLTGALALLALILVKLGLPDPESRKTEGARSEQPSLLEVLIDPRLLRLNIGVFVLHAVLMVLWVVVPFELRASGLEVPDHWKIYLPVMAGSLLLMVPAIVYSERHGWQRGAFVAAVALLVFAEALFAIAGHALVTLFLALFAFFTAFNVLEATLPSLISRAAPPAVKGTALGIYSSMQFLGTFAGAIIGGWLSQHHGPTAVFAFCIGLTLFWLFVAARPGPLATRALASDSAR
jgi:MFS family permease